MVQAATVPALRERRVLIGMLVLLAAVAWAVLFWQSAMGMRESGWLMGMSAIPFLLLWIVMMVAMMFPAAAPTILMFAQVYGKRKQQGRPYVPTAVFVVGYLLIWTIFGAVAYGLASALTLAARHVPWLMQHAATIGGNLIILAGLYQLSPLKRSCLTKCRSPFEFFMSSWKDGYGGAFVMGLQHGAYCFGCCWLLFLILFPLGMMNIGVMVTLTFLIAAEKSLPRGQQIARILAGALIFYGLVVLFVPALFPMTQF